MERGGAGTTREHRSGRGGDCGSAVRLRGGAELAVLGRARLARPALVRAGGADCRRLLGAERSDHAGVDADPAMTVYFTRAQLLIGALHVASWIRYAAVYLQEPLGRPGRWPPVV